MTPVFARSCFTCLFLFFSLGPAMLHTCTSLYSSLAPFGPPTQKHTHFSQIQSPALSFLGRYTSVRYWKPNADSAWTGVGVCVCMSMPQSYE